MYNSRTNPTHPVFDQQLFNQHCRRKNHKKPHHPSKVQSMNCFTAKACGRWLPLLSITLQGCTSFRHLTPVRLLADYIPFIVSPQPRLPAQECFHSFHSAQANPPPVRPLADFIPLPFGFTTHNPELKAKTGSSIPPTPIRYIAFSHHPCFSPCQPAVCPAKCSPLKTKDLKIPRHPLMVQVKIKDHSRMAFVPAASSSHSFNRSLGRSYLATPAL